VNDELLYYLIIFLGIFLSALASIGVAIFLSKHLEKKQKT